MVPRKHGLSTESERKGTNLFSPSFCRTKPKRLWKKMEVKTNFLQHRERMRQNIPLPPKDPISTIWAQRIRVTMGMLQKSPIKVSIYKVPNELRKVKGEAYNPRIISIGPLHEGERDLLAMEEHKWRYMQSLLHRTPNQVIQNTILEEWCRAVISNLEERARASYAEDIKFDKNELAEIMLVDGCFILELFISSWDPSLREKGDPIFHNAWMVPTLQHDLALLENQIPFFVLKRLFEIFVAHIPMFPSYQIVDLALSFFQRTTTNQEATTRDHQCHLLNVNVERRNVWHLLHLLHNFYLPSNRETSSQMLPSNGETSSQMLPSNSETSSQMLPSNGETSSQMLPSNRETSSQMLPSNRETLGFRKCVTQLLEAGVEIEKGGEDHLLNIRFSNGVIKIPPLWIRETTESLLRNLIAFEQCSSLDTTHHITSYTILMNSLIHSPSDVQLLQQRGIITNSLGGVEDVLTLFNNILKQVVLKDFCFGELCEDVNAYQKSWWHRYRRSAFWKVRIQRFIEEWKKDEFFSPWRIISYILLILTGIQTFYAVRSYYPQ